MTHDEFFASYVKLIEKRHSAALATAPNAQQLTVMLAKLKAGGTARLRDVAYDYLFVFPPVPLAAPTGCCTYLIGNEVFCIDHVTKAECDEMPAGVWTPGACAVERIYQ